MIKLSKLKKAKKYMNKDLNFKTVEIEVHKAYKDYRKEKYLTYLRNNYLWIIYIMIITVVLIPAAVVIIFYFDYQLKKVGLFYTDVVERYKEKAQNKFVERYKEILNNENYDFFYYMEYYFHRKYKINILKYIKENNSLYLYKLITDKNVYTEKIYEYLSNATRNYKVYELYIEITKLIETNKLLDLKVNEYMMIQKKLLELSDEEKEEFFKFEYGELKYKRFVSI